MFYWILNLNDCSKKHVESAISCSKYLHETSHSCSEKYVWFQYVS